MISRRKLLHTLVGGVAAGAGLMNFPLSVKFKKAGAVTPGKTLIFINQGGGMDGIHNFPPYWDAHYAAYARSRPTVRFASPTAVNPDVPRCNPLPGSNEVGIHPDLEPLMDIFERDQNMAVLMGVGIPEGTGSHFTSSDFMFSGTPEPGADGFGNRYLAANPAEGSLRGVGLQYSETLRGAYPAPFMRNLRSLRVSADYVDDMRQMFDEMFTSSVRNHEIIHHQGATLIDTLDLVDMVPDDHVPEGGGTYSGLGRMGQGLELAAQLLKSGIRPEFMETSGTGAQDVHSGANGNGPTASRRAMAQNLRTFYDDLGPELMQDVVVVVGSEFGRTIRENNSRGVDHGAGNVWFAIGGNVQGGIYGQTPIVDRDHPKNANALNRNLGWEINFKDVMIQIMERHLGAENAEAAFPGHTKTDDPNVRFIASSAV